MTGTLAGQKIAILATDGVDQVGLAWPWEAILEAGGEVHLIALAGDDIRGISDRGTGSSFAVDKCLSTCSVQDYDALILPGGSAHVTALCNEPAALGFVREFSRQCRPVAAICDAPAILAKAGMVNGVKLTSFPALAHCIRSAGGRWIDAAVVINDGIVTTRQADDLDEFCDALVGLLRPVVAQRVNVRPGVLCDTPHGTAGFG